MESQNTFDFPGSELASKPGAHHTGPDTVRFVVWAPEKKSIAIKLLEPSERLVELEKQDGGFWTGNISGVPAGSRYWVRIDEDRDRPDPASRHQPEGVHGPSATVDFSEFEWLEPEDEWRGQPWCESVLYELHIGTFTAEGTFDAAIERLPDLVALGVTAVEIMPLAAFPGERNWGYDGVHPFAVQDSYGGVDGLRRFVMACHRKGLSVVLDVVYNHLGPEGNYLWDFAPYFTDHYKTPWGWAINVDGEHSDPVRAYFEANARMWFEDFHIDSLRLDAVHAIYDFSARPFLAQLTESVDAWSRELGRPLTLIAESDQNDRRIIESREYSGLGFHSQWSDDFHHAVHTLLTKERNGYYANYGKLADLAKCLRQGWCLDGGYAPSRQRRFGNSPEGLPADRFCVCVQNHDQVGNRALGERFSHLLELEAQKLAAAVLCLSPFVPMLFMGEEYGEPSPFLYFVDHSDEGLIKGVRKGRKKEFAAFHATGEPPDPCGPETLEQSVLNWHLHRQDSMHGALWNFYRRALKLRRELPALKPALAEHRSVAFDEGCELLWMLRGRGTERALLILNFATDPRELEIGNMIDQSSSAAGVRWHKVLDSAHPRWMGPGEMAASELGPIDSLRVRGHSAVLYRS